MNKEQIIVIEWIQNLETRVDGYLKQGWLIEHILCDNRTEGTRFVIVFSREKRVARGDIVDYA